MPFSITRHFGGQKKVWNVYTRAEADARGLDYVYWKEAEEGDWALSDDGYVARCVGKSGPYEHSTSAVGERYQFTFPFARAWSSQELLFEERREAGDYTGTSTRSWIEVELGRTRAQRALKAYARILATEGRPTSEQMKRLGEMYRPDQAIPAATFKRLLKMPETKDMVAREIARLLAGHEIDEDYVIKKYKETYEDARDAGHTGTQKAVIDRFAELLRMDADEPPHEEREVEWGYLDAGEESEQSALPPVAETTDETG